MFNFANPYIIIYIEYYMTPIESNQNALRIIGTPVMKEGRYVLNEFAILNKECGWICPCCNNEVRICPSVGGQQVFSCSTCHTEFQVNVDCQADTFLPTKKKKPAMGLLITPMAVTPAPPMPNGPVSGGEQRHEAFLQWGGMFSKKKYLLQQGQTFIGRKDRQKPSDVEFDDPEMSRQSVRIDIVPDEKGGLAYMFCVLKSLNPVMVNGKAIDQGLTIKLYNGDNITMGKTTMTFKINK